MKKGILIAVALLPLLSFSQSWQWGKRAGGITGMDLAAGGVVFDTEQVKSMLTDGEGNVYFSGKVGPIGLDCDGVALQGYSVTGSNSTSDNLIASFDCSGAYRWSKVIGGYENDYLNRIQNDQEGNVYASGRVIRGTDQASTVHFDTDTILPYNSISDQYKKGLYLVKYAENGDFEWLRMPQPDNTTTVQNISQSLSFDLSVDPQGNIYWMTYLFPGAYADGQYTVTTSGIHLLKYDGQGNFLGGSPFQMTISGLAFYKLKMFRNHNSGTIYLVGNLDQDGSSQVVLGGQQVTHNSYLAAFDSNGQFLWKRENSLTYSVFGYGGFQDGCVDPAGNIYICGHTYVNDIFLGYSMSSSTAFTGIIYKISPEGNLIWASYAPDSEGIAVFGVTANQTTAAITGHYATLNWGPYSATLPPNGGGNVFLMTFDAQNGNPTNFSYLTSNVALESPRDIVEDIHGNYYVGGFIESIMYINPPNDYITNSGQETDLFIAKYGSDDCALGLSEPSRATPALWPNPVRDVLHLENMAAGSSYELYDLTGKKLLSGTLGESASIDVRGLAKGMYLVRMDGKAIYKILKQ